MDEGGMWVGYEFNPCPLAGKQKLRPPLLATV